MPGLYGAIGKELNLVERVGFTGYFMRERKLK
jgi:hypothetical protein